MTRAENDRQSPAHTGGSRTGKRKPVRTDAALPGFRLNEEQCRDGPKYDLIGTWY
jgi:hypothetical protein